MCNFSLFPIGFDIFIRRVDVTRPVRSHNLTAKLKDPSNMSAPELSFQRKAVQDFHSRSAQFPQPTENYHLPALSMPSLPFVSLSTGIASTSQHKRSISVVTEDGNTPKQLAAKKNQTEASSSRAKAMDMTSDIIDAMEMEDAYGNVHAKGTILLICFDMS
jgi:hypothetical protein